MTPADVVRASNEWVYVPDGAPALETEDYLLVRFPDHFVNRLELVRFSPRRPVPEVVAHVLYRAHGFQLPSLVWRVRLDSPPGVEQALVDVGGAIDETLEVFALDLGDGKPDLGRHEVELRWATDVVTARDALTVGVEVFGGAMPPDAEIYRTAAHEAVTLPVGRGGSVVAYVDGVPVGTGGISSRGPVAGLWGGAVLDACRGRGIYRALLAARLDYAAAHHMTMALIKGRVETSSPILRRAGFGVYGQERSYRIPLA
ncbi:MAG: GNAT family N-acetyltransferase [Actinomycetota bacterium]|nr:GNAT family N-acetyltransferase [Actinomycetota bacterium]